ncbi:MAG: hypothetical protein JRN15_21610 [Nitrososphaerota archaeon]|nr:hypothetical protein [Nitrososphaerota archaeon]
MQNPVMRLKETRDNLLGRIELYSKPDSAAARSISSLLDSFKNHLKEDDDLTFPLVDSLLSSLQSGKFTTQLDSNNFARATRLQESFQNICLEHREIKRKIEQATKVASTIQDGNLVLLLRELSHYVEFEESILYPVAKAVAYSTVSRSHQFAIDPCLVPADKPPEAFELMCGIP